MAVVWEKVRDRGRSDLEREQMEQKFWNMQQYKKSFGTVVEKFWDGGEGGM